jgi:hypothetical protein
MMVTALSMQLIDKAMVLAGRVFNVASSAATCMWHGANAAVGHWKQGGSCQTPLFRHVQADC